MARIFVKQRMIDDNIRRVTNISGSLCIQEEGGRHSRSRPQCPAGTPVMVEFAQAENSPVRGLFSMAPNLLIFYQGACHVEPSTGEGDRKRADGKLVLLPVGPQGTAPPRERPLSCRAQGRGKHRQVEDSDRRPRQKDVHFFKDRFKYFK